MNTLRRFTKWILAVFAAVFFLSVASCIVFVCWQKYILIPKYPDKQLRESIFKAKRPLFDQIRKMAFEEQTQAFHARRYDWQSGGLPEERLLDYRRLLSSIQPGMALVVNNPDELGNQTATFIFQEGGTMLVTGPHWSNGITYLPANVERYGHEVLRIRDINLKEEDECLLPIEEPWYIFYEQD